MGGRLAGMVVLASPVVAANSEPGYSQAGARPLSGRFLDNLNYAILFETPFLVCKAGELSHSCSCENICIAAISFESTLRDHLREALSGHGFKLGPHLPVSVPFVVGGGGVWGVVV